MDPFGRTVARWMRAFSPWRAPICGTLLGLAYGVGEHLLDAQRLEDSRILSLFHDVVEYLLPVTLGAMAGLIINFAHRQARLNLSLSTQNTKLQRQFFTQTLSAHILHEIRNPLHNLAAVIDSWQRQAPEEEAVMLRRNLSRLTLVAEQLSRWDAFDDSIDLREPTLMRPWIGEFLTDKVQPQLAHTDIAIEHRVEPVTVHMHPLLLEQCFVTVFANAIEAASQGRPPRAIVLSARMHPDRGDQVEVEIRNTGSRYPEAVLASQAGAPAESARGLGLGLVLVRRALEQVGGALQLANRDGQACTMLSIPGRR